MQASWYFRILVEFLSFALFYAYEKNKAEKGDTMGGRYLYLRDS